MEEIRNVLHFIFLINTQGFKSFAARDEVCFSNRTKNDDHSLRLQAKGISIQSKIQSMSNHFRPRFLKSWITLYI